MNGVTFGEYHSWDEWGLLLKSKSIGLPAPHTEYVSVIGRNGDIDLTEALSGEISYENRELTFTFLTRENLSNLQWNFLLTSIATALHGKSLDIVIDDDLSWKYIGRCTIDSFSTKWDSSTVVIKCNCNPYKISTVDDGDAWKWDPFSFVDGVIYTNSVTVDGEATVNLVSPGMIVSPTFICSDAMTVTFDGTDYDLVAGTTTVYDIRLQPGDNYVTFTGSGTVSISYTKGVL